MAKRRLGAGAVVLATAVGIGGCGGMMSGEGMMQKAMKTDGGTMKTDKPMMDKDKGMMEKKP